MLTFWRPTWMNANCLITSGMWPNFKGEHILEGEGKWVESATFLWTTGKHMQWSCLESTSFFWEVKYDGQKGRAATFWVPSKLKLGSLECHHFLLSSEFGYTRQDIASIRCPPQYMKYMWLDRLHLSYLRCFWERYRLFSY
jgi:hypothetical protein